MEPTEVPALLRQGGDDRLNTIRSLKARDVA
jgi:hypothetical protein